MSGMAISTDRPGPSFVRYLPVDTLPIYGVYAGVAFAASSGNVVAKDRRVLLGFSFYVVGTVAVATVSRYQKATFGNGPTVNAVQVKLVNVSNRDIKPLDQVRVRMAAGAGSGQVQVINSGARVLLLKY